MPEQLTVLKCSKCNNGFLIGTIVVKAPPCPVCKDCRAYPIASMKDLLILKIKRGNSSATRSIDRVIAEAEILANQFKKEMSR
jgi:hypothetical protein